MRENYHQQNGHFLIDNGLYFSDITQKMSTNNLCQNLESANILFVHLHIKSSMKTLHVSTILSSRNSFTILCNIQRENIRLICFRKMRIDNIVAKFWTLAQIEILICLYLKRWIPWKDQAWILGFLAQAFIKVTKETNTKTSYAP